MTNEGEIGRIFSSPADFLIAAESYTPEMPLPMLDCPQVRRDLGRLPPGTGMWRPDNPEDHPVAYIAGDRFAPIGRMLAVAGSRPLLNVDLADLPPVKKGTLTVVCDPSLLGPQLLAAINGAVGFFTARNLPACSALLLRTLTDMQFGETLLFDSALPYRRSSRRLYGPAVTPTALTADQAGHERFVLAGRAHGRECMLTFGGGSICGLAGITVDPGTPIPLGQNLASCQHTAECIRRDMAPREAVSQPRGSDLRATAVLLDSCRSTAVGGRFSGDVTLALAVLDSTAVSVVGCPTARQGPAFTPAVFAALLNGGMPAGSVVEILNRATSSLAIGDLVLLGDAAREWKRRGALARHALTGPTTEPAVTDAPAVLLATDPSVARVNVESDDGECLLAIRLTPREWLIAHPEAELITGHLLIHASTLHIVDKVRDVILPSLDAMAVWGDHGFRTTTDKLSELTDRAQGLAVSVLTDGSVVGMQKADSEYADLSSAVLAEQSAFVDAWMVRVQEGKDRYVDDWPQPVTFAPPSDITCPRCGGAGLRYPAVAGSRVRTPLFLSVCALCGEIEAGADDAEHSIEISAVPPIRQGDLLTARVAVTGFSGPAAVSIGLALSHSQLSETSFIGRYDDIVNAGAKISFETQGRVGRDASADTQTLRAVAVVNGRPIVATRTVWVLPATDRFIPIQKVTAFSQSREALTHDGCNPQLGDHGRRGSGEEP